VSSAPSALALQIELALDFDFDGVPFSALSFPLLSIKEFAHSTCMR